MTILITGATDGLGRALAQRLNAEGERLLVHGRDPQRLRETIDELDSARGLLADFASLADVHALADEVLAATDELTVLVNNAGIGTGAPESTGRAESRDGHELRLAVNYLATFALTMRLLDLLKASAPARVVIVASLGQAPLDFDDPMLEHGYSGERAYSQSKLAQITFAMELAERLGPDAGVTVNSLHPATYMPTKIVPGASVDSLETGVEATHRLVKASELEGVTGRFFDRQREARADEQAYDPDARARLWALSEALTAR